MSTSKPTPPNDYRNLTGNRILAARFAACKKQVKEYAAERYGHHVASKLTDDDIASLAAVRVAVLADQPLTEFDHALDRMDVVRQPKPAAKPAPRAADEAENEKETPAPTAPNEVLAARLEAMRPSERITYARSIGIA